MPVKRKRAISRSVKISPDALARWRKIRPKGIEVERDCGMLVDNVLADALGIPALLWLFETREAYDQLEAAMGNERHQAT